jgi:hypothetical protein
MDKLKEEIKSFQNLWKGGYKNNIEDSSVRNLQGIYKYCLEPYKSNATILEIGPGHGCWTIKMERAKKIYCLDALSSEHNDFNVNHTDIEYYQVDDFSCRMVPDDSIDLLFSYDTFCHISYTGTKEYLKNIYPKLKKGSNCFIMIADYDKYKKTETNLEYPDIYNSLEESIKDYDGPAYPGRWYWYGIKKFCELLKEYKYEIINKDIDIDYKNPICHFKK